MQETLIRGENCDSGLPVQKITEEKGLGMAQVVQHLA
jgi:hypothetical protein